MDVGVAFLMLWLCLWCVWVCVFLGRKGESGRRCGEFTRLEELR